MPTFGHKISVIFPVFSSTSNFIYLFTRRCYNYLFPKYKDDGRTARRTDILKCIKYIEIIYKHIRHLQVHVPFQRVELALLGLHQIGLSTSKKKIDFMTGRKPQKRVNPFTIILLVVASVQYCSHALVLCLVTSQRQLGFIQKYFVLAVLWRSFEFTK